MPKVYKIHPSIGVARVGNSEEFFLGPEIPQGSPVALDGDGLESPVVKYKDAAYRIKRQAARFRVYEFDVDGSGQELGYREITADHAVIRWSAEVANNKPAYGSRNPQEPNRNHLKIQPGSRTIAGRNQSGVAFDTGRTFGVRVPLGQLRTDNVGRLVFIPASSDAASVPAGKPLNSAFDNDYWYDATCDGPVTATVQFAGQPPIQIAPENSAWVVAGPPDYLPAVDPRFVLYDHAEAVAVKKGWTTIPERPSFTRDLYPKILRYARIKWSLESPEVPFDGAYLVAAPEGERRRIRDLICGRSFAEEIPAEERVDLDAGMARPDPATCVYMSRYAAGSYERDWPGVPAGVTPNGLDRANLGAVQGQPFGRGIEVWGIASEEDSFISPFRISPITRKAGDLTDYLATPWHTDFYACVSSYWWPAQRPNDIYLEASGPRASWASPIANFDEMVKSYWRLGYVTGVREGTPNERFFETERDPSFPRRTAVHPEPKRRQATAP